MKISEKAIMKISGKAKNNEIWTHLPIDQPFRTAMYVATLHHRGSKSKSLTTLSESQCVNRTIS